MAPIENREKFIELANELEGEDPLKYADVIYSLRNMEYDDFANERFATPKMQMISDFTELGRLDIVERVKNGEGVKYVHAGKTAGHPHHFDYELINIATGEYGSLREEKA